MPQYSGYLPAIESIVFVNDFITAILLFSHYSITPSRAVLALASGYLYTALIVIPHILTFPGSFTPTGLWRGSADERMVVLFLGRGTAVGRDHLRVPA